MNLGKHRLAGFLAGMAAVAGAWPGFTPSDHPWGPPSAKPEHLRDAEDNRKLQLARERRERRKGKK